MTANDARFLEIKRRLGDYKAHDIVAARNELIETWKRAHPDAANQPPSEHHVLIQLNGGNLDDTEHPERWANDVYMVTVRRWSEDKVFGTGGGMVQIGINAHDGTARHDWRDFQN